MNEVKKELELIYSKLKDLEQEIKLREEFEDVYIPSFIKGRLRFIESYIKQSIYYIKYKGD